MTSTTQSRMNVALSLAIPAAGLAYLTSGVSPTSTGSGLGTLVAVGVLWATAIVALNAMPRRQETVVSRPFVGNLLRRQQSESGVIDVSRPTIPWCWTSVLLVPLELLAVAWSIPFFVLLVTVPIAVAIATALWVGRTVLGP